MRGKIWLHVIGMFAVFSLSFGIWGLSPHEAKAQSGQQALESPKFEVDPFWPKTLPDRWVVSRVTGVCVDAKDHVFVVNRGDIYPQIAKTAIAAPPVTEFDPQGNLINSWGNRDLLPKGIHGCYFDYQGNVWFAGNQDGIVQKYSHDGSKLLLQIGIKGRFDTSDGSASGAPMNSSHTLLNLPAGVAVDPTNGDVYVADGYGNRRVVVFDSRGNFLRQWGRQGTLAEAEAGVPGAFLSIVHCVAMGNDGLVYVCDREGERIQVFDKTGNFQRNIPVEDKTDPPKGFPLVAWIAFSPDPAQKFLYVGACLTGTIRVLNRVTGETLSKFGREGTQVGEMGSAHTLAVDSKSNIYVGDITLRRLVTFRLVR